MGTVLKRDRPVLARTSRRYGACIRPTRYRYRPEAVCRREVVRHTAEARQPNGKAAQWNAAGKSEDEEG